MIIIYLHITNTQLKDETQTLHRPLRSYPLLQETGSDSRTTTASCVPPARSASPSSPDGSAVDGSGGDVDLAGWICVQ